MTSLTTSSRIPPTKLYIQIDKLIDSNYVLLVHLHYTSFVFNVSSVSLFLFSFVFLLTELLATNVHTRPLETAADDQGSHESQIHIYLLLCTKDQ